MPARQRVVQICLFLVAAIALAGGTLQMVLGQPDTSPRLDNVHRFMAGVYLSMGVISLWAGVTVRRQTTLIWLIAFAVAMAAVGRLVSMAQVGLPQPHALWLAYLGSEIVLPLVLVWAHRGAGRVATGAAAHA
jgi:Domain of unknown function (DUF4345)